MILFRRVAVKNVTLSIRGCLKPRLLSFRAWGLRRIARMLTELGHAENMTEISEIAGGGHWFDGIGRSSLRDHGRLERNDTLPLVNDDIMQSFFDRHLSPESPRRPSLPSTFVLTTMNPATFQGKGGIRILQLDVPFRIATIAVKRTVDDARERWTIRTSNVQRFGFYILPGLPFPSDGVRIDGSLFSGPVETLPRKLFCKVEEGWKVCEDTGLTYLDRNPMNYGPARQVCG